MRAAPLGTTAEVLGLMLLLACALPLAAGSQGGELRLTDKGVFRHTSDEQWAARWRAVRMTRPGGSPPPLAAAAPTTVTLTPGQIAAAMTATVSYVDAGANTTAVWTPRVKNQGACGSCAVFSLIAAIEVQSARLHGKLVSLSEQSILDCVSGPGMFGCNGADILDLANAMLSSVIAEERNYEYTSYINQTGFACNSNVAARTYLQAVEVLQRNSSYHYEDIMAAYVLARGPLQVSIDASPSVFRRYSSGIIRDGPSGREASVNHGVAIMGFGEDAADGTPYWLVKNSWGPQWGESGYFRVERRKKLFGIDQLPVGVQVL